MWAFIVDAYKCEEVRNKIIHSVWHLGEKAAVRWKHVLKPKKIRFDREEFDEKSLNEITQRFTECRKGLENLIEKYYPGWSDRIYDK